MSTVQCTNYQEITVIQGSWPTEPSANLYCVVDVGSRSWCCRFTKAETAGNFKSEHAQSNQILVIMLQEIAQEAASCSAANAKGQINEAYKP